MTRKTFIADVATAAERCTSSGIPGVSRIARGNEDGELDFCYSSVSTGDITVHIFATGMLRSGLQKTVA